MGLQTSEEVHDFIDAKPDDSGNFTVNLDDLQNQSAPPIPDADSDIVEADIVTDSTESATKTAESATDLTESASETTETVTAADTDGLNFE